MSSYDRISWLRLVVSGILLAVGLGLALHWLIHPAEDHPPVLLVVLLIVLGASGLLPVEVSATIGHVRDIMPWADKPAEDRRSTCGTCWHPAHPGTACEAPLVGQGTCGCTGQ